MNPNAPSPLEIFYGWQAILLAAAVSGLTQIAKKALERRLALRSTTGQSGEDLRQQNWLINDIALPLVPLVLGAVLGAVVPAHPEVLVAYTRGTGREWLVYAMWGAGVGQFSDYLYTRLKRVMAAAAGARVSNPPAAPAVVTPVEPAGPANPAADEDVPPVEVDGPSSPR